MTADRRRSNQSDAYNLNRSKDLLRFLEILGGDQKTALRRSPGRKASVPPEVLFLIGTVPEPLAAVLDAFRPSPFTV